MAARRPAHKAAHPECPYGAENWAECDQRAKEVRGRCVALTEKATECTNWATDDFEDRGYCGQHYGSRVNAALEARRAEVKKAGMLERIDAYLASVGQEPHECGARCQFLEANPAPVSQPRRGVYWSARSGLPLGAALP